ncbi:hypothetical protein GCM10009716_10590 [Streptomyces sodiiphilus]|uniref:HTH luxR-type domain-containing protein n=1 Tax=Streptomyces sodiiphilus TaxID=226217 RepID=A0ABN2NTM4_9ACTN
MVKIGAGGRPAVSHPTLSLYQELRSRGAASLSEAVDALGLDVAEGERCRAELIQLGLIAPVDATHATRQDLEAGTLPEGAPDHVTAIAPEVALLRLLLHEQERLREHLHQADRSYSRLETLASGFLRADSLTLSEVEVEVLTDYRRIQQVLEDIADTVRDSLSSMSPGALAREVPERVLSRDRRQLEKGVRVRVICNQRFTSVPESADLFRRRAELGVEIRLSPVVPMNMTIADKQSALLPIDPENQPTGAILASGPALVRSYLALYEYCWHTAVPYGENDQPELGGDGLSEQQRATLRMLASGMKDEKIARSLGVSLRTVSRLISELMHDLGASSRFEAGVRAAQKGWLA